jgi:hypothetical protein
MPRIRFFCSAIVVCSLTLAAAACGRDMTPIPPTQAQALDEAVAGTATALSSAAAHTSTPKQLENQQCPIPPGEPPLPVMSPASTIPGQLLAYLNAGGSTSALRSHLEAGFFLPGEGLNTVQMDFTGNGYQDLVLPILNLESQSAIPSGTLLFFECTGEQYALNYSTFQASDPGMPVIYAAQDLNGDSIIDILAGYKHCGAHTCSIQAEALLWNGTTLENRFQGTTGDLPTPTVEVLTSPTLGSVEIAITANGILSVGAGPFRPITRIWTWDATTHNFVSTEEFQHPPTFRIHVLHDADKAAGLGDYDTAVILYNRVVEDDSLVDWGEEELTHAELVAYAMYRRVLTHLQEDQAELALAALNMIDASFSIGEVGYAYADMAELLWNAYQAEGDLHSACGIVQTYARRNSESILDPLYYGYANPSYAAADICPTDP